MPSPGASRSNLEKARAQGKVKRVRSDRESWIIKLLIWQWFFDPKPRPSQRQLACQFGVSQPYVLKVARKAHPVGWDALAKYGRRVTLDDLTRARQFTGRLRNMEPGLLAPAPQPRASDEPPEMATDERIAERWREVAEWKRKNPCDGRLRTMQEWQERSGRRRTG